MTANVTLSVPNLSSSSSGCFYYPFHLLILVPLLILLWVLPLERFLDHRRLFLNGFLVVCQLRVVLSNHLLLGRRIAPPVQPPVGRHAHVAIAKQLVLPSLARVAHRGLVAAFLAIDEGRHVSTWLARPACPY